MPAFLNSPSFVCILRKRAQTKTGKVAVSVKFLWKLHRHIPHSTKTNFALTAANLGTDFEATTILLTVRVNSRLLAMNFN